jgi:hypothetical protein
VGEEVPCPRHRYAHPKQPYYFGNWNPSEDLDVFKGVDALASDAYEVADAMLRIRKLDLGTEELESPS